MSESKRSFQPAALALSGAAALLRLAPHPANFTSVGGLALFSGSRLKGWQAYLVPLLAMAVTDPILSRMAGYAAFSKATIVIYASMLIYVFLGRAIIGAGANPWRITVAATLGSTQFFLITNFFVWLDNGGLYAHTSAGLLECYAAALPFFSRTLLGDLFYSGVLFGSHTLVTRMQERPAQGQAL